MAESAMTETTNWSVMQPDGKSLLVFAPKCLSPTLLRGIWFYFRCVSTTVHIPERTS
jgi:hypothetical protein